MSRIISKKIVASGIIDRKQRMRVIEENEIRKMKVKKWSEKLRVIYLSEKRKDSNKSTSILAQLLWKYLAKVFNGIIELKDKKKHKLMP